VERRNRKLVFELFEQVKPSPRTDKGRRHERGSPSPQSSNLATPDGYRGFYGFHKYWGKKPREPIAYIIAHLTLPGDTVLDPFVGAEVTARESVVSGRRFIGFDINPVAILLARLLLSPPPQPVFTAAAKLIEKKARHSIEQTYLLDDQKTVASHYLSRGTDLLRVWVANGKNSRIERTPTRHDLELSHQFDDYKSRRVRHPRFFNNSRINATSSLTLGDLFEGRAQHNIDILLDAIDQCPPSTIPALKLCLTAASGQMSKMVFAITGRGKTRGLQADKVEVGSWVIGYWRPELHFEINVWRCFAHRLLKLSQSLSSEHNLTCKVTDNSLHTLEQSADATITLGDCRELLKGLPNDCIDLVLSDPPHSDRVPYLELSELWNSVLGFESDFEREIVVSNARGRDKTLAVYSMSIADTLNELYRVLKPGGFLALFFNARSAEDWAALRVINTTVTNIGARLTYEGSFPCIYSATSVVQDNRRGSLKTDNVLIFSKADQSSPRSVRRLNQLACVPGWSCAFPVQQHK